MNDNFVLELPEDLRPVLRRPLGVLVKNGAEAAELLKGKQVIAVGDATAAALIRAGVKPKVIIIDNRTLRGPASSEDLRVVKEFEGEEEVVENPPGTITPAVWAALRRVGGPTKILVKGEEDLLTIPAILVSPTGTAVAYGQPGEGVVVVEATEEKKREVLELLKKFRRRG